MLCFIIQKHVRQTASSQNKSVNLAHWGHLKTEPGRWNASRISIIDQSVTSSGSLDVLSAPVVPSIHL